MSQSRLIELSYYDPGAEVRLTAYADTLVLDERRGERTMTAIRFGGYPEMVNAMAAAIHGGVAIDATIRDESIRTDHVPLEAINKELSRHESNSQQAIIMELSCEESCCSAGNNQAAEQAGIHSTAGNCQADDRQESCSSAGNCQALKSHVTRS